MTEITCFEGYEILKKNYGIDFLINTFGIHKGTSKRWEKLKNISKNYENDLQRIFKKMAKENPKIGMFRFKKKFFS